MRKSVNYALLFESEISSSLIEYSRKLNLRFNSALVLGPACLPHVTVLQFEYEDTQIAKLWDTLETVSPNTIALTFSGLTLVPSKEGDVWVEISVLRNSSLFHLQERILALDELVSAPVFNATGEMYRPHITLARIVKPTEVVKIPLEYDVLQLSAVTAYPSLGLSGPNFEYRQRVCGKNIL